MPKAPVPLDEADRLAALRSYQILDAACENTFGNLIHLAARLTGCPTALVSLVDEHRQWFAGRHGLQVTEMHRDMAFCAHAILDPSNAMIVEDAAADARFADNPLVTGSLGVRFYIGVKLVDPQGHPLGTLCVIDYEPKQVDPVQVGILQEITQAVMSAMELWKAAALARTLSAKAADRFAELIEALPSALVLTRRDGRIDMINRGTERLFGYRRGELQGQPLETLLPERYRQCHVGLREDFIKDMSSRPMGTGKALFGLRKDRTEFPLEIGINPINFDGEKMALAVICDASERQAIEAERQRQSQELARSNTDLQEFAYAASHDLKAPLRAIGHLADWIREDIVPDAKYETVENLDLLKGRVLRLQSMLDGMLAYSRVGRDGSPAENVNIAKVINDITSMLDLPPGFAVVCEGEMPVIRTHRSPLETVLKNLISNGLQHHDRTSGLITVSMKMTGLMAEFRVSDDGPGIPLAYHKTILLIFQTLKPRDDKESSGMGLAIVKKAVEDHGGTIRIESNPPTRGTTFIFTWSVAPDGRQNGEYSAGRRRQSRRHGGEAGVPHAEDRQSGDRGA